MEFFDFFWFFFDFFYILDFLQYRVFFFFWLVTQLVTLMLSILYNHKGIANIRVTSWVTSQKKKTPCMILMMFSHMDGWRLTRYRGLCLWQPSASLLSALIFSLALSSVLLRPRCCRAALQPDLYAVWSWAWRCWRLCWRFFLQTLSWVER